MSALIDGSDDARDALAALLEGSLSPAEQAALEVRIQNDPAVCAEWASLLRQDVLLGEVFTEDQFMNASSRKTAASIPIQASSKRIGKVHWLVASAACVLLAWAGWMVSREIQTPVDTAVLALLTGDAQIVRGGDIMAGHEGMTLQAGDYVQLIGKGARSEVRFTDGSRISAEQGTRWTWVVKERGKREIVLESGALSALIEKQNNRAVYVFISEEARVTVIGTRFRFSTLNLASTLELFEGAVKFQRRSDQQEISVAAGQRVIAGSNSKQVLAATPLNPPAPSIQPQTKHKALLVTAEPLPFYAHDVAVQRALQNLGFDVELTTFDRVTTVAADAHDLVVVPSHKCKHDKVLRDVRAPVIAWHNEWHRDLGLMSYDATLDHGLKLRSVTWVEALPDQFKEMTRTTQLAFELNIYSSLPEVRGVAPVLKLTENAVRNPLALFTKGPTEAAGPRVAFSIDIREGSGNGARVETGEELFAATVRWCLSQREAKK